MQISIHTLHTYMPNVYWQFFASGCWVSGSINKYKYKKTNTEIQIQRPLAVLASDDAVQGGSGRAGQPRRPLPPPTIIQRRPSSPVYGSIPYYIYGIILHMCKYSLYVCKSILCISSCCSNGVFIIGSPQKSTQKLIWG